MEHSPPSSVALITRSTFLAMGALTLAGWCSTADAQLVETRSYDGTGNHPLDYGAAGGVLPRIVPNGYLDGESQPNMTLPGARSISNSVFDQVHRAPDPNGLSEMVWAWGQFIDHDMDLTPLQSGGETISIPVPVNDPLLTGAMIPMDRSIFTTDSSGVRQQSNVITSFLDASNVYGSDATRAQWLRSGVGGAMKTTTINGQDYLPVVGIDPNAPAMEGGPFGIDPSQQWVAGDVRANEHAVLSAMHTTFVREHNRIAADLATNLVLPSDPAAADEMIYQAARKIVGAEIQAITYREFLPVMGVDLSAYSGFDPSADPRTSSEFSTAGWRMGHSQVNGVTPLLTSSGPTGTEIDLVAGFWQPDLLTTLGPEDLFRSLAANSQQTTDAQVVDELRNLLFGPPTGGPIANGTDLVALNIQRGRDHGLCSFTDLQSALGLTPVDSFLALTGDAERAAALGAIYDDVTDVDMWVGLLIQERDADDVLGAVNERIVAMQFEAIRDGDRFFYLNDPDLAEDGALGALGYSAEAIGAMTLGEIFAMNTGFDSGGGSVFLVPEPGTGLLAALGGLLAMRRRRG